MVLNHLQVLVCLLMLGEFPEQDLNLHQDIENCLAMQAESIGGEDPVVVFSFDIQEPGTLAPCEKALLLESKPQIEVSCILLIVEGNDK